MWLRICRIKVVFPIPFAPVIAMRSSRSIEISGICNFLDSSRAIMSAGIVKRIRRGETEPSIQK
ncbi:MAG: hypothetical protein BWX44_01659 [Spirochaetes bacterium ADurb.Bin001]|nr:MAG: hypothetical protein BWX44_01659 [Spirochaetes bacterium ADurb.Bin001]